MSSMLLIFFAFVKNNTSFFYRYLLLFLFLGNSQLSLAMNEILKREENNSNAKLIELFFRLLN